MALLSPELRAAERAADVMEGLEMAWAAVTILPLAFLKILSNPSLSQSGIVYIHKTLKGTLKTKTNRPLALRILTAHM